MSEGLLTCKELAEKLRIRPATALAWARAGRIPVIRVGPKVLRFDFGDVCEAIRTAQGKGAHHG